jgi:uncharacterized SAM-binding protein YcdF (DUF218 family)
MQSLQKRPSFSEAATPVARDQTPSADGTSRRLASRGASTSPRAWRFVRDSLAGVALWCVLYMLQILPWRLGDTPGIVIFLGLGLLVSAANLRRYADLALGAALILVCVVADTPVSQELARWWVRGDSVPAEGVSAAVVLSGTVNPDTTISGESLDHLLSGIELVAHGKAALLVTTTTSEPFSNGFVVSDVDQARIITLSGIGARWRRATGGRSTRDEAIAAAASLLPAGARRIAVVTSPMHTRRACAVFEAVGFVVTCVPSRLRGPGAIPVAPTPADRLAVFGQWVYELSAVAKYSVRGWMR